MVRFGWALQLTASALGIATRGAAGKLNLLFEPKPLVKSFIPKKVAALRVRNLIIVYAQCIIEHLLMISAASKCDRYETQKISDNVENFFLEINCFGF